MSVALVGGTSRLNGVLVVTLADSSGSSNGTVCSRMFTDSSASVVCSQLGFKRGVAIASAENAAEVAVAGLPIVLNELTCGGFEDTVSACPHLPWGYNTCAPSDAVTVSCDPPQSIRLAGGGTSYSSGKYHLHSCFTRYSL